MASALARADKSRQLAQTSRALTVAQQNAIDLLVTGKSDGEVAAAVGVSHQTVCGWRNYNPWFRAELTRRRNEIWRSSGDRLRALIPRALAVLEAELVCEFAIDPMKAALAVLKLAGAARLVAPPDEDEPEEALERLDAEARRRADVLEVLAKPEVNDWQRAEVLADWSARAAEDAPPEPPESAERSA